MSVEFHEEAITPVRPAERLPSGFTGFLMRLRIIENERQGKVVLGIVAALILALAAYIFIQANPPRPNPTPAEQEEFLRMKNLGE